VSNKNKILIISYDINIKSIEYYVGICILLCIESTENMYVEVKLCIKFNTLLKSRYFLSEMMNTRGKKYMDSA